LKLISFNPDSAEAKEWMALKISEAITEAKEMKLKRERELAAMEKEMARSKKAEQKKTLRPPRFFRASKDNIDESEDFVDSALTTASTNSSSVLLSNKVQQQEQQQNINICCAGDYCFVSNGHKVVCGMTCRVCTKPCHSSCCEDDEYGLKICTQCEKVQACDEV